MKYRPSRLIKSYAKELGARVRLLLRFATMHAAAKTRLLRAWLALRWDESLFKRYLLCQTEDFLRSLHFIRHSRCMQAGLTICAVMCLGFFVISPHEQKASYKVRVDMTRPQLTALSDTERQRFATPTAYDLAAIYTTRTGNESSWFYAGSLEQTVAPATPQAKKEDAERPKIATWYSKSSSLGIADGQVVMRSALGEKNIKKLGDIKLNAYSTALPQRGLQSFAEGISNQETLLAELNLQNSAKAHNITMHGGLAEPNRQDTSSSLDAEFSYTANFNPRWQHANYGADIFQEPNRHWSGQQLATAEEAICPQNRMEQASWLNMLYVSHNKSSIYAVRKAKNYSPYVERFAGHYSLPPSLVYAIMRVESGFNPLAISHANALGLMQVVPDTAGNEVHVFLRGKKASPAPEVLFTPESNIEYGTTYLHLLSTRHFKDVKNPISREMCIIAAYNGGPNAVYRVFNRNRDEAIKQINRLTPEQLYSTLLAKLPSQETRDYLPRVLSARNDFLRGQAMMH